LLILQLVLSGLLVGGLYALVAAGLNLIFGVLRIINFAHGELLMVALYGAWFLWAAGFDPYASAVVVIPAMFVVGWLIERLLVRQTAGQAAYVKIFVTLGLALMLQNLALLLFSGDYRNIRVPYQTTVLALGDLAMSVPRLAAFLVALAAAAALHAFLKYADLGKAIRAVTQDRRAAALMAIDVARIQTLAFALGCALVGLSACMILPLYSVFPTVGLDFVLISFVVVVLGGLGNLIGTFVGGLIIGVVEQLSGFFVETALRQVVYFVVFILVLAWRPAGLLGRRGSEELGLR
jgi:branched-chain amino acid transport system permease protein